MLVVLPLPVPSNLQEETFCRSDQVRRSIIPDMKDALRNTDGQRENQILDRTQLKEMRAFPQKQTSRFHDIITKQNRKKKSSEDNQA